MAQVSSFQGNQDWSAETREKKTFKGSLQLRVPAGKLAGSTCRADCITPKLKWVGITEVQDFQSGQNKRFKNLFC